MLVSQKWPAICPNPTQSYVLLGTLSFLSINYLLHLELRAILPGKELNLAIRDEPDYRSATFFRTQGGARARQDRSRGAPTGATIGHSLQGCEDVSRNSITRVFRAVKVKRRLTIDPRRGFAKALLNPLASIPSERLMSNL